jgi:hypothetical protein
MQNQVKTETTDMIPKEDESKTVPQSGTLTPLIDPEDERRVRRKIDCVVLPLVSNYAFYMVL